MASFLTLILCVLMFASGDYFAARWGKEREWWLLILAMGVGPIAYLIFGYLSATTSLSKMGGYVNSGVVLFSALAGVLFLGERLSRMGWLSLFVIIAGITMLAVSRVDQAG